MRKSISTLAILLMSSLVMAQTATTTENYVKTTVYQVKTTDGEHKAGTTTDLVDDDKIESITYYDGLGRPIQSIAKQAGGNRQDIITPMIYDALGRQPLSYLPYANASQSTSGSLSFNDPPQLLTDLEAYYVGKFPEDQLTLTSINAYSEQSFEASPLNRVLEQGAPGADWKLDANSDTDHTIKFDYQTNVTGEVDLYRVIFPTGNTEQPQLFYDGNYAANELYKTITKDENWQPTGSTQFDKLHTTEEFKDKQGRVILKRTYNESFGAVIEHDTYYVYDDYGNLTYVLSPLGTDRILSSTTYKKSFVQILDCSVLVPKDREGSPVTTCIKGIEVDLDHINEELTINFNNITFGASIGLETGPIAQLNGNIPDMMIGTFSGMGYSYTVSILNGYLYLSGSGAVSMSGINQSFTVSLPSYTVVTSELDDLCYQYHYDKRNRLIEKKIPQKDWEYIVYDKLDRPVLTQDALLRVDNDWLFTKYDAFGRVVYTGRFLNQKDETRLELSQILNSETNLNETSTGTIHYISGTQIFYDNQAYPRSDVEVLSINYYDGYNSHLSTAIPDPGVTIYSDQISYDIKTLPTGSKVKVLGTNNWITSVTYYDDKGQAIYVGSKNDELATTDIIVSDFDFTGKVLETTSTHSKTGNAVIEITDAFTYDHAGRMLTQTQTITGDTPETIVNNTYDELGQLESKGVGGIAASPLQTVDYTYNIRGWLKQINDVEQLGNDLFSFKLNYNTKDVTNSPSNYIALYNGNISETIWKTVNDQTNGVEARGYAYRYDNLNRILNADYGVRNAGLYNLSSGFDLLGMKYDKNGNILTLSRVGNGVEIDKLAYTYNGNQLDKVTDNTTGWANEGFNDGNTSGNDYAYDANGNMIEDKNKGITSITYNHLNLPSTVTFANGSISYIYDASGVKLKKTVNDNGTLTTTKYAGNFIYEEDGTGENLRFFSHPEGYVEPDGQGGYDYAYQYKDHLGNIRLAFKDTNGDYQSILESTFDEHHNGWTFAGNQTHGSVELDNGRLKVNVQNQWNGTRFEVGDDFAPGDEVTISLDVDTGDTPLVRVFLQELDANGNHLNWYVINNDLSTGTYTHTHTIVAGPRLRLKFDKSNINQGLQTHFYVDNVFIEKGGLEILEENNYYPFGLKHKGYNNVVNGTDHPYGFGGKEENDELGLGWMDFGARNYQADLGRWMNIDNLSEKYYSHSPYNYTMNNPTYFIDPDGQEVIIHFDKKRNKLYIYDKDKWDTSLDSKVVTADNYKFSFEEGEEKYNQILVINDVFSGGQADSDGDISYGQTDAQKEIPNGEFDVTDNEASSYAPDWYRLDPKDNKPHNDRYDNENEKNSDGELRDGFRLHLGSTSHGCVTLCSRGTDEEQKQKKNEWNVLNKIIKTTKTRTVNDKRGRQGLNPFSRLTIYGTMTVSGQNPKPKKKSN
ncbi:DUF6443 domain-containing protein [Pontimicrobium sp. IMCC45349]|uniref:DUF6443 domain-containing protein n=1 Tax=Pontimicrobium sp. IMCC45349 TaxID=3391574 RepID=UPI0039A0741A